MTKFLLFFLCLSTLAQGIKFKGLTLPAYSIDGQLESIIRCQNAVHENGAVNMNGVELEVFADSKTLMKTSKCKYLQSDKKVRGHKRIFIESKKMELSGEGFEYDLSTKELKIHKNVVIYLNITEEDEK